MSTAPHQPEHSPRRSFSGSVRRGVRGRGPRSLRARLVVVSVALIAVVAAVIGTVTTVALHSYLQRQLDAQLEDVSHRAMGPPGMKRPPGFDDLSFLTRGGQPIGTVGAAVASKTGEISTAKISVQGSGNTRRSSVTSRNLTAEQTAALDRVPRDGNPHTVGLADAGDYRVRTVSVKGDVLLVGLPTRSVTDTLNTLVVVELCVTGGGLMAAGLAAAASVRLAMRPLQRMAQTAARVSELPLHSGEVRLSERVPEEDTDPHTEVGQVGAALNRMLGHVASALTARHESEMGVRQFVADASHELRTPLASIRGYAELPRRGHEEVGPETQHALGRIEAESMRMSGLVEDLLLLARLDAGRPVEHAATDLVPLVVDAVSDARAVGTGHLWRLDLPGVPVEVHGEVARLQQMLVNLLANARTHTPDGTTVTARVWPADASGTVWLEIEDDGPGIPPQMLPRVFERFTRGDVSRSRAHGSTGLGLAIVHAVAIAHGGTVDVSSRPGRTVFTVSLPMCSAE